MNKDPELNYYALKLAISLKGDDGDTFTKVYDEICKSASLTNEQINWIKDKIRELQQSQSDTLLQTRLNWYEGILNKNKEETTIEENTNQKEYEKSLTHLRSVMHSIVDNQPSMKSFTPPSTSLSCAQQSLNSVSSTDINKNFDGPHISKPPMITPVQKQDFFSGFDDIDSNGTEMTDMKNKNATYVDIDEGVNFPLLGGPQKHRDYSTIKIDSDHESELVDWKPIADGEETSTDNQNRKQKKKKRKNGSNDGSEIGSNGTNENGIETGPEPMEIDGEIKTKKSRSQRRSEQKKKLEEKKMKDQELSERGQLESALGLSKKAVTPVQNVPIIYPEKKKKRTIKEFRAEKERNQRTFYNLKGIAGNIVLVQNPRSLTPMIGNITTGQSQTELLKQQREQLAQEKAKDWKIPQWVEDEERERRKKKLKNKNRKIEETKHQKTKKLPETQDEIKNETYTEQEDPVLETEKESTITTTGQAKVETVVPIKVPDSPDNIDGDDWTCFSKKKEKKSKPTGNEITKSVQSPIKSHLPVQTIEPEIHVQDEVWPELISEVPKNQAPISRLPIRTPSPPQKENPETESETDRPTPDEEPEKYQTTLDQSKSDHDIEPDVSIDELEVATKTPEVSIEEPEVTVQKSEVSTFQSVTNNLMGLNFMMESCEIGEVDHSPVELDQNIRVEGNLNFLVESNIEQEDVRRLPMSNVTNLEDIEGDQHVIKPSDHYPYHTDTVQFLESRYNAVLNRLKNGSAKNYQA